MNPVSLSVREQYGHHVGNQASKGGGEPRGTFKGGLLLGSKKNLLRPGDVGELNPAKGGKGKLTNKLTEKDHS